MDVYTINSYKAIEMGVAGLPKNIAGIRFRIYSVKGAQPRLRKTVRRIRLPQPPDHLKTNRLFLNNED